MPTSVKRDCGKGRSAPSDKTFVPELGSPFELRFEEVALHERDPAYDGRLLRGERTRQLIVDSMIALTNEGNTRPTAKLVAERAGVSLRLIFHHFSDVDAILRTAAVVQTGRHWKKLTVIPPTGPVAKRIELTIDQRRKFFTPITPLRQAIGTRVFEDESIRSFLVAIRQRLRSGMASTFEPELDKAGDQAVILLDTMEMMASWSTWNYLRLEKRKSGVAAQRTMEFSLGAVLRGP